VGGETHGLDLGVEVWLGWLDAGAVVVAGGGEAERGERGQRGAELIESMLRQLVSDVFLLPSPWLPQSIPPLRSGEPSLAVSNPSNAGSREEKTHAAFARNPDEKNPSKTNSKPNHTHATNHTEQGFRRTKSRERERGRNPNGAWAEEQSR